MLNQNHSTVQATREKMNPTASETMTKNDSHSQSWAEGKDHLLLYGGKALSNAAQDVTGHLSCKAALLAHDQLVF